MPSAGPTDDDSTRDSCLLYAQRSVQSTKFLRPSRLLRRLKIRRTVISLDSFVCNEKKFYFQHPLSESPEREKDFLLHFCEFWDHMNAILQQSKVFTSYLL